MGTGFTFYDVARLNVVSMFEKAAKGELTPYEFVLHNEIGACIDTYQDNPEKFGVVGDIIWVVGEDVDKNVVGFAVVSLSRAEDVKTSRTLATRPAVTSGSILEVRVRMDLRTSTNLLETLIAKADTLVRQRDIELKSSQAFPLLAQRKLLA